MLGRLLFPLEYIVDVDGRPLREHAADEGVLRGVPFEVAECRYPGSRHKHKNPMNLSALRQMNVHWADIVAGLCAVRGLFDLDKVRYVDLWRIGEAVACLPRFLVYRAEQPVPIDRLPGHVAGMFKVVVGLNGSILNLAQSTLLVAPDRVDAAVDTKELFEHIEGAGLLIGPEFVCAGTESLIRRAIAALVDPPAAGHAATAALIHDQDRFRSFARICSNVLVLQNVYVMIAESLYARMRRAIVAKLSPSAPLPLQEGMPSNALLADVDGELAAELLRRVLDVTIDLTGESEALRTPVGALAGVLSSSDDLLADAAMKAKAFGVGGAEFVEAVGAYLRLERAAEALFDVLQPSYLASLGLGSSRHIVDLSRHFEPPSMIVRHLLATVLGGAFVRQRFVVRGGDVRL